jgi:hypothetical protein
MPAMTWRTVGRWLSVALSLVLELPCGASAHAADPPTKWRASCFVFRDVNRNGLYDMGDFAYAGLAIEMKRPDNSIIRSISNLSGFANFEQLLHDPGKGDIYTVGTYRIHATPEFGWIVSTPNTADQIIEFRTQENAGSGLVPVHPCRNIGVAPELTINGAVVAEPGTLLSDLSVRARGVDGQINDIAIDEAGNFIIAAKPGNWRIEITNHRSGRTVVRNVDVGAYAVTLSATNPDILQSTVLLSHPETADFDGLLLSPSVREIPSGYSGLNWSYWVAAHNKFYNGRGYVNATTSGEFVAYNSSGVPASIWRDEPFDFIGAYFAAAWPRGQEESVTVTAWRKGELVYTDVFAISNSGAQRFDADYRSIDRIEFLHGNYERIVIDDFTFRR